MIIVKVVFPLPIRQFFEYFMPHEMHPIIGGRILAPFRSKDIIGIVISFYQKNDLIESNLRYVKELIDNKAIYTDVLLYLLKWVSKNYYCPIGNVFFSILPKILRAKHIIKKKYIYQWIITKKGQEIDTKQFIKNKKQLNTLLFLKRNSILSLELKKYNVSKFILKKLEEQGLCQISIYSKPFSENTYFCKNKNFFLNKKIIDCIKNILINKKFSSWLLTKVNLYTKIKFYLQLIRSVLQKNSQVLIVVPYIKEINIISVFLKKFFNVAIYTIHSGLTDSQYLNTWISVQNRESSITIGLNQSVFLPFLNLGVIIFLEEHNFNYKSTEKCRCNFRDIGILRAYKEKIPIILDSDTPSLKTLHNISLKKCFFIKIKQNSNLTKINNNIIDLKKEKIKFGLSLTLINKINTNFKNKQVLLIFNKFDVFFFVLTCRICGYIHQCSDCKNYFEVNQYYNFLFCRFCLTKIKKPLFCYHCRTISLIVKKINIKTMRNRIKKIFPQKPLFFLLDKKSFHDFFLDRKSFDFTISLPCIIFTKEDIVQHYYFPYVKLISLICIDNYFFSFHFRSIEYFSQFYVNLKKLTKKTTKSLKILVQTSFPHNLDLKELYKNGYFILADKILKNRKKYFLPPWSVQGIIYSQSSDFRENIIFLNLISKILKKKSKKHDNFLWCLGPYPCFEVKNLKKNIYQLLVQCSSRTHLNNLLNESINIINYFAISKTVQWIVDIEPN